MTEIEKNIVIFRSIDNSKIDASTVKQNTNGAQVIEAYNKRYNLGYYSTDYDLEKVFNCKLVKDCEKKTYIGITHKEMLPAADDLISDQRVIDQVKTLLPDNKAIQKCEDLESLANILYEQKPTVTLVTFQAETSGFNVIKQGNFGNIAGDIYTTGPFQVPVGALDGYASEFQSYCKIEDGKFIITDFEKFGQEALSGVPLNHNGAYMITTVVPINGENIALPSVKNKSSYQGYFVSGGQLLSGGTEMTIKPLKDIIPIGTQIPEGGSGILLDKATGITCEIQLLK